MYIHIQARNIKLQTWFCETTIFLMLGVLVNPMLNFPKFGCPQPKSSSRGHIDAVVFLA